MVYFSLHFTLTTAFVRGAKFFAHWWLLSIVSMEEGKKDASVRVEGTIACR